MLRMMALAQAYLDRRGTATIVSASCPENIAERLQREGIAFQMLHLGSSMPGSASDLNKTVALGKSLGARWIVLDGYHFDVTYQRALRTAGFRVLTADDYGHCEVWAADAVLNQNIFAPELAYRSEVAHCRFLLGTRFALLRREFRTAADSTASSSVASGSISTQPIRRLLITLGGADEHNVTGRLLEILNSLSESRLKIKVLVGASNPHHVMLERTVAASLHAVELHRNVTDMPPLYEWAEGVISAGGSTCWEWLLYQKRAAVVCLAENQRPVVASLAKRELALDLGWQADLERRATSDLLQNWLKRQSAAPIIRSEEIVDALGTERVASLLDESRVYLRAARSYDARLWFEWANDPVVRANGFFPETIAWETHAKWFEYNRKFEGSRLWLGFNLKEEALGYVRLHNRSRNEWEIGVAVSSTQRGRGMGRRLVELALRKFCCEQTTNSIPPIVVARIKPANIASLKLFQSAGFQEDCARRTSDSCLLTFKLAK